MTTQSNQNLSTSAGWVQSRANTASIGCNSLRTLLRSASNRAHAPNGRAPTAEEIDAWIYVLESIHGLADDIETECNDNLCPALRGDTA